MIPFIDTSLLIAAMTREPKTATVQAWLRMTGNIHAAAWIRPEALSALSIKVRSNRLTSAEMAGAATQIERIFASVIAVVQITPQHLVETTRLCARTDLNLRAPDALHIAVAASAGGVLWTLDVGQAAAAHVVGLPCEMLT